MLKTIVQGSSSWRRPIQAHTNASVEACATLTPLFGAERSKMPCYLATTPKFTQNPAMKHRRLSSGNKRLAKASPVGSVWGIGLRADDPRAKDPRQWRGENLLGEALSAVRDAIRDSETGLAHLASVGPFRTPTEKTGIHKISSAPQSCSFTAASACQGPLWRFRPTSRTRRPTKARKVWR